MATNKGATMAPVSAADDQEKVMSNVSSLRDRIKAHAEEVLQKVMPRKVLELDAAFNDPAFSLMWDDLQQASESNVTTTSVSTATALKDTDNGSVSTATIKKRKISAVNEEDPAGDAEAYPQNRVIQKVLSLLRNELLKLIENCAIIKLWVQLSIPRMEDGGNFGVACQEETVNELARTEDNCFTILEGVAKYYVTRGKLVSKIMKYPNSGDYRESVKWLDYKFYTHLRLCSVDLRNSYLLTHDMLVKNLDRLQKPRSSGHQTMF